MSQSFARPGAAQQASVSDSRFNALAGRLYVTNRQQWDSAVGISPARFYELLTADLPGEPVVSVDFTGGGQGDLEIRSSANGRSLFWAERSFSRNSGTMNLREVRIENPDLRRKGIGKVLLDNQFRLAREWGLKRFEFKAGREDGPYFWSRRGAEIAAFANVAPERQPAARFAEDIQNGLRYLKGTLSAAFEQQARNAIASAGNRANVEIARLPGDADGEAMAALLFGYVTEFRAEFRLDDPVQMQRVIESFGNIESVRAALRAEFGDSPALPKAPASGALPTLRAP